MTTFTLQRSTLKLFYRSHTLKCKSSQSWAWAGKQLFEDAKERFKQKRNKKNKRRNKRNKTSKYMQLVESKWIDEIFVYIFFKDAKLYIFDSKTLTIINNTFAMWSEVKNWHFHFVVTLFSPFLYIVHNSWLCLLMVLTILNRNWYYWWLVVYKWHDSSHLGCNK